jgi:hypothetical protein
MLAFSLIHTPKYPAITFASLTALRRFVKNDTVAADPTDSDFQGRFVDRSTLVATETDLCRMRKTRLKPWHAWDRAVIV